MKMHTTVGLLAAIMFSLSVTPNPASAQQAAELSAFGKRIKAAMGSDIRSAEEVARDANRKPIETLDFFGITEDMRVLELFPGGGWYTKLLAPALADKGQLYTAFTGSSIKPLIEKYQELSAVKHLDFKSDFQPTDIRGIFNVKGYKLDVKKLDAVLTFRNYHNLSAESHDILNKQVFAALKKGGRYGIVDHTLRHNAPVTQEIFRRFDPVQAILEVQAAGFVLEAISDLHYRPDDSLQFDTQRATVKGNSDRFTLLFRKP
ncbi:MAG: methyltransferase [Gammaproteobacteria bacterium]|nr:methyltransferase [Gammaproteobacteria bacterium]